MGYDRTLRVSEEIRKVVSTLIQFELKDPRISALTTVTRVETTNDYSFTTIYVSVMGSDEDKANTVLGLEQAKGFIRREIGKKIKLRTTPEPIFKLDDSLEYSSKMSKLIDEVISHDASISNTASLESDDN